MKTEKTIKTIKQQHAPDCTCSICGLNYKGFSFKNGYVCETCLTYIKNSASPEVPDDPQPL